MSTNVTNNIIFSRDEDVRELAEVIGKDIGDLDELRTEDKTSLVGAINELKDRGDAANNKGFVSAKEAQSFNDEQKKQARDNIGAVSQADLPDTTKFATKEELSNLVVGLTEEQVRAIIEEYHPPKPKDQGLAKDYSGSGWYKATDTGVVYNKGVPEGETHIFEGDPKEYISVYTKEDAVKYANRAATSNMTNMTELFKDNVNFNEDISHWDVSNVTEMMRMFYGASLYNQPLNNWDVSNVSNMNGIFWFAKAFNQPLNNWDVSKVVTLKYAFRNANAFNQSLGDWDVSNVTDMGAMFMYAIAYNQDLSQWCVSKIASRPSYFDEGVNSWTKPRPVWGTCPRGEDQA